MWQTSNPALNNDVFDQVYGKRGMFASQSRPETTTLQGVVYKTGFLVAIAIAAGAVGYWLFGLYPASLWISAIAGGLICFGIGWVLCGKPQISPVLAPIYAVVEGVFLGAFTALADKIVAGGKLATAMGGVGLQAFIVTASVFAVMLVLYRARIVQPTQRFKAVVATATGAIFLAYLVSFVMSLFWKPLPLISFASATQDVGWMGLLGLGVNVFILIIAALWLVIDFGMVEEKVQAGAPVYMEWYCAFALLVTLAWIYYESVKLIIRVAAIFGNRR